MKLHRHLVEQILFVIDEIFATGRPADKVLERVLKAQRKWGARDRRFVAETCYEIVRHWRRLWVSSGLPDAEFLDPEELTPDRIWRVWAQYQFETAGEIPTWNELGGFRPRPVNPRDLPRAVRESIPDWLDDIGEKDFGADWDAVLTALNQPADVFLRANRLKADPVRVIEALHADGVDAVPVPGWPDALRLSIRKNVFKTKAFHEGLFEVQDAASQLVAPFLEPKSGDRIADACAGGGGKTLHLASLMKNKGKILAMDVHEWKLGELKLRARRGGVDIVETRVIESMKTIKRLEASFDRVLLDVPCTGIGVLRRNPDTKWKLQPDELERLTLLQKEILHGYSRMVKPGGTLVYATCSLLTRENVDQVQSFLASESGKSWTLEEQKSLRPDREGFDGFFMARLCKNS